jgi:2-polyprenyl-3-methyl-5-hydroxy-6-metoxy-1,4-benzoquinol methylase
VFLSSLEQIDENFYKNSGMHKDSDSLDLETWSKETFFDDERRFNIYAEMIKNKDILDFGCGTGGFLLMARQITKNVYGIELEQRLQKYFIENNLNVCQTVEGFDKKVDYIFLFHVLEHIKDPIPVLQELSWKLNPNGRIVVEVPNADDALLTLYQNKAFSCFTYWSPHLYLYNHNTLRMLAQKANLKLDAIKQIQRYPLSNHLYWLAEGKQGGHIRWNFLNNSELKNAYENSLASIGKCDTIVGYLGKF